MSKYRMRAAALLAAGAVAGGATAATLTATADEGSTGDATSADSRPGPGGHGGPGAHGGGGAHVDTAALATELGVTEDELTAALEAVREDLRPGDGERPAAGEKPTDEERADRQAALAKALADELGLDESTVADALESVRDAHQAERRTELSDRLDEAVADGDLTDADKASVLKAYDAGVLGGR